MKHLLIIIIILSPFYSFSQDLFNSKNRITILGGIDPATILTLRYERKIDSAFFQRKLFPFIEYSTSMTQIGLTQGEIKVGQRLESWNNKSLKLITGLNTSYGKTSSLNFDSQKIAMEIDFAFGFYRKRGFFALTTSFEKILATRLKHSDQYRERFYSDAKDAWYKGGGGSLQMGAEGGIAIKNILEIFLEFKIPRTEKLRPMMGSPAHANIGFAYRI